MPMYAKESIEALRQKVDLVEVISAYVPLKRSGTSYKGLCPFHVEKTPSFTVQKGDAHYHCFGCGAHGDAIAFLMEQGKLSFQEALETLSERFRVPLEKVEAGEEGVNKSRLKALMERACLWYHFFLLHAEEAHAALLYLYGRELSLSFLERFQIGYAPKQGKMLVTLLQEEGFSLEELQTVGLARKDKDFFVDRILFPIRDRRGSVIGFSARKFHEETPGGKYVNTPGTPLFKKSQVLFGFCYSRAKIAKERKALVVEGQIDALRLIHQGFDFTVAGQGTAFGEEHVQELIQLGVEKVYLAMDADIAGKEAMVKVGRRFQEQGVEVLVLMLPEGSDPDAFLREQGKEAFTALLQQGIDYLTFYYHHLCAEKDVTSPAQKSSIVETIAEVVRAWKHPVLVHESLKKLAELASLPREMLPGGDLPILSRPVRKREMLPASLVDADRVLEVDLLRWMLLSKEKMTWVSQVVQHNLSVERLKNPACARLFSLYLELSHEQRQDRLFFMSRLEKLEEQQLLVEVLATPVCLSKVDTGFVETVRKILIRGWMERKEQIYQQMRQENLSPDEELFLAKQYSEMGRQEPSVLLSFAQEKGKEKC
ncbi:MAG: DNA primase [Chlamydiae bacterium]|nr:DNA primase [Chlamydiota bacterium]